MISNEHGLCRVLLTLLELIGKLLLWFDDLQYNKTGISYFGRYE